MKLAIMLSLTLSTFAAFASPATCPTDSQTIKTCKSTPESGDDIVASEMLDSLAICQKNGETLMIPESNGESFPGVVTVTTRPGSTSYTLFEGEDVEFNLSVVTGTRLPVKKATFSVIFKAAGRSAKSTYTCK